MIVLAFSFVFGAVLSNAQAATTNATFRVKLGWAANTETNLAGYKLYYGAASRTYTNVISLPLTAFTGTYVTNLTGTNAYYFSVTATNSIGSESDYSNEAVFIAPPPPAAPRGFKIFLIELTP